MDGDACDGFADGDFQPVDVERVIAIGAGHFHRAEDGDAAGTDADAVVAAAAIINDRVAEQVASDGDGALAAELQAVVAAVGGEFDVLADLQPRVRLHGEHVHGGAALVGDAAGDGGGGCAEGEGEAVAAVDDAEVARDGGDEAVEFHGVHARAHAEGGVAFHDEAVGFEGVVARAGVHREGLEAAEIDEVHAVVAARGGDGELRDGTDVETLYAHFVDGGLHQGGVVLALDAPGGRARLEDGDGVVQIVAGERQLVGDGIIDGEDDSGGGDAGFEAFDGGMVVHKWVGSISRRR